MVLGRSVMLAPTRGEVIVPAGDQVPLLELGSKTIAVPRTVEPFLPPATRIFPLLFCSVMTICCSRGGLGIEARVLNAF
jgi:hypothetical protein